VPLALAHRSVAQLSRLDPGWQAAQAVAAKKSVHLLGEQCSSQKRSALSATWMVRRSGRASGFVSVVAD